MRTAGTTTPAFTAEVVGILHELVAKVNGLSDVGTVR